MTRLSFFPVLAVAALAIGACAPRADSVAAVPMPANMFAHLDCNQARAERAGIAAEVQALSQAQNNAATGDAIGVFLIGVPASSVFGGDKAGNLSASKGKLLAVDARLMSC